MRAPGATPSLADGSTDAADCANRPASAAASGTLLLSGAAAAAAGLTWWLLTPGGRRAARSWCRRSTSAKSRADATSASGGSLALAKPAPAVGSAEAPNSSVETAENLLEAPTAGSTAASKEDAFEIDAGTEGLRSRQCDHDSASSALSSPAQRKVSAALGLLSGSAHLCTSSAGNLSDGDGCQLGSEPRATAHAAARQAPAVAVATARPVVSVGVRAEDVEVCLRKDGSLWRIGGGAYGSVYKAVRHLEGGRKQFVAVKVIVADASEKHRQDFEKEIAILKSCQDANIVSFLGSCTDSQQMLLITELMPRGDLHRAMSRDVDGSLRWFRRPIGGESAPGRGQRIALDIARGLAFLHSRGIVHLDIKSPNVLLGVDYTAKIADVGMATLQHQDYVSVHEFLGTFAWTAPEVLLGQRCNEKVDLFSFGVVLWEIVTGEAPARGRLRPPRVPEECPRAVADLMEQCLAADPAQRPTAREVVALLQQPDTVLRRPLPCGPRSLRSASQQAVDGEEGSELGLGLAIQESTRQQAEAVYGGPAEVERRRYAPAEASAIGRQVDRSLWADSIRVLSECLADPDVEDPRSPAHARVALICICVERGFKLKMAANSGWAHALQDVKDVKVGEAAGAGSAAASAAADHVAILEALHLSPRQVDHMLAVRRKWLVATRQICAERAALAEALAALDLAGESDASLRRDSSPASCDFEEVDSIQQELQHSVKEEGVAYNQYFMGVLCALSPVQQARLAVLSAPFMWQPVALAELLASRQPAEASTPQQQAEVPGSLPPRPMSDADQLGVAAAARTAPDSSGDSSGVCSRKVQGPAKRQGSSVGLDALLSSRPGSVRRQSGTGRKHRLDTGTQPTALR